MSTSPWDCLSCGARAQVKAFCEQCGAAQPIDGEDSALSMMLGLVCEACDGYNDPGESVCASCGTALATDAPSSTATPAAGNEILPAISATAATLPPAMTPSITPPLMASVPVAEKPRADPPSWMSAPTGRPLSTQFALPKVDLATVASAAEGKGIAAPKAPLAPLLQPEPSATREPPLMATSTPLSTPMLPSPNAAKTPPCWRCAVALEPDDKFCRNCGARSNEAPSPLATTQIAAAKMPSPLPSPVFPQGATMVMPAMRLAQQAPAAAERLGQAPPATMLFGAPTERAAKLVLVRGQSQFGSQWRLAATETVIGRTEGAVTFPDDKTMASVHCKLVFRGAAGVDGGGDLWLEPAPTQNGVFLRVREPMQLKAQDEIVVGAQRLRVLADDERPHVVTADPTTRTLGSLVRPSPPIMLLRIGSEPAHNEVFHRCQRLLTIGRNNCDLNFPRDSFVSERHAQLTNDGGSLVLEDLRSRNGTYVRVHAATRLQHGDLVLLGDKVLRVELPR